MRLTHLLREMESLRTDTVGGKEGKMSQKKGEHDGLMVRVDQISRAPEINLSNLLLDRLLNPLPREEKIIILTEFLQKPEHRRHKDSGKILRALEFLFAEDGIRSLNEKEAVAFRKHLIDFYYKCEKNYWGAAYLGDGIHDCDRGFILKLLEKVIEGWAWATDYSSGSVAKRRLYEDAASCFSFVCGVCRKDEKKNYSGTDFQKKIWEIFRKSVEYGWTFKQLTPWILRAPEGIAVVLLKQRTRLGGKDLLPEIQLLLEFYSKGAGRN